ncbi:RdgB/HAM1 family non-canonical purine NTP pyrophosphatase [Bowmanella sp. Y26]|uniref:RdgB/HAM1 family non-canonical purine NTP pyrophosphatase n=1 Tax=Bowmanella yangjiangensis TaxID=2811230 RepID=UPI001BDC2FC4|nr:RdgB/HAM1 family non-canonical purine NTP pyrophosphatase [Bowmanella yangjiangensis]MBT1062630.1 RdgB/HAM1 family non-canonical purine NTP pyrophosphatase [Bowmanella yangjiangensis]
MQQTWVMATGNPGKVKELAKMLSPLNVDIRVQSEFGVQDADETGLSFVENAILKARHAARITGLPAIADDSGLAVDALGGAPGIYSARYAGQGAGDTANLQKLLHAMQDVSDDKRSARFICVLVWLRHADDPTPIICQGQWQGSITRTPAGSGGFGYDPVFWVPEQGCTSAELSSEVKNQLSHRAQALRQLLPQLEAALV